MTKANGKRARWRLRLLHFEFDIFRHAGVKRHAAEVLLRVQTGEGDKNTGRRNTSDDDIRLRTCPE